MPDQKPEDVLDAFFREISSEETSFTESSNDFGKRIQASIQESLQRHGYDDLGDLITKTMDSAVRYVGPQAAVSEISAPPKVKDGFTYVQNELSKVRYDMRHRGAFRDGHQAALQTYFSQMQEATKNIKFLEEPIIL